jgi:hypothetical protein
VGSLEAVSLAHPSEDTWTRTATCEPAIQRIEDGRFLPLLVREPIQRFAYDFTRRTVPTTLDLFRHERIELWTEAVAGRPWHQSIVLDI